MNDNEISVFAISNMAFNSLWFLGACRQPENKSKTVDEVYKATIGSVSGITDPVINAGTAILGAYALFVLPRGTSFDEFSKALTGKNKLDWTGFTWTEPDEWGPNPGEHKNKNNRTDDLVLGGIRNGLAHGNFEIETDDPDTTTIHLWSQKDAASDPKRHVRVSVTNLADFVMRFHKLFTDWHDNGKKFLKSPPI